MDAATEEMRDQDCPGAVSHQSLGQLQPRRQRGDVEVDGHRHQPVRLQDADHVRVRDRRNKDLRARWKVERGKQQVKPRANRTACQTLAARRPRGLEFGGQPLGVVRSGAGCDRISEIT